MLDEMTIRELIPFMIKAAGETNYSLSKKIGRSPHFIAQTLLRGNIPKLTTLLTVARACGFRFILVPEEEQLPNVAIIITPEEDE